MSEWRLRSNAWPCCGVRFAIAPHRLDSSSRERNRTRPLSYLEQAMRARPGFSRLCRFPSQPEMPGECGLQEFLVAGADPRSVLGG